MSDAQPLVSVIIPVCNSEDYLEECVQSILNQTYQNTELLLIDDGSTDQSISIIKGLQREDERIRLIENEENKGIPYTRNRGLYHANGKYIALMDSDDISRPERFERQVRELEEHPDIDAVGTNFSFIGRGLRGRKKAPFTEPNALQIQTLFSSPLVNPSSMYRRKLYTEHNISYNERFFVAQDYDFWLQVSKVGRLKIIDDDLFQYRADHSNITNDSKSAKLERRKKILNEIHRDALSYYQFDLTEEEAELFCLFFNDDQPLYSQYIDYAPALYQKLDQINQEKMIFNQKLFRQVAFNRFMFVIGNADRPIRDKQTAYKRMTKVYRPSSRPWLKLVAKHSYYKLKGLF